MSLLDKMIEKIGIVDEEYDDDGVDEGAEEEKNAKSKETFAGKENDESGVPPEFLQHLHRKPVSYAKPVEQGVGLESDESPVPKQVEPKPTKKINFFGSRKNEKQEINPVTALAKALHVTIVYPEDFNASQGIAEYLKRDQSVIINYEKTDEVVAARISDFVCGVVYAVGGSVQQISKTSMFCAPKMVDVETKVLAPNREEE